MEIRYRTETSTDPETGETTSEEVPYEYYILNVKLTSKPISCLLYTSDAVSECRTAADQTAELNETGHVGLLRLAEIWSAIRAKEGMGGLILEGTEAKILSDVVAQFYACLLYTSHQDFAYLCQLHQSDGPEPGLLG